MSSDGGGIAHFELTFADGGTRIIDGVKASYTAPVPEPVLISARARDQRADGVFHLDIARRGFDDFSDDQRYAATLQVNTALGGDIDTFRFVHSHSTCTDSR